jgi:hypothetical protein
MIGNSDLARIIVWAKSALGALLWVSSARGRRRRRSDETLHGTGPDLDTMRPASPAYGEQWTVPITCRWLALNRRAARAGGGMLRVSCSAHQRELAAAKCPSRWAPLPLLAHSLLVRELANCQHIQPVGLERVFSTAAGAAASTRKLGSARFSGRLSFCSAWASGKWGRQRLPFDLRA